MHDFDDLGAFLVDQIQKLLAQALIPLRGHVVAGAGRDGRQGQVLIIVAVGFLGKRFVHGRDCAQALVDVQDVRDIRHSITLVRTALEARRARRFETRKNEINGNTREGFKSCPMSSRLDLQHAC